MTTTRIYSCSGTILTTERPWLLLTPRLSRLSVALLIVLTGVTVVVSGYGHTAAAGGVSEDMQPAIYPERVAQDLYVEATFGIDVLRQVERDSKVVIIEHDQLQRDGFRIDIHTQRRLPHLVREKPDARAWALAPKAGKYHVGFMMHDNFRDERVAIRIDGELQGVAVANRKNNRTWLWWLKKAYEFRGGERVELAALGSAGKHGICKMLFIPEPPQPRGLPYEVRYTQTAVCGDETGKVTVSWTTTSPSTAQFEYGRDTSYGRVAMSDHSAVVHRLHLAGLQAGVAYHGRAVGTRPDNTEYYGPDITFSADPRVPPPTVADIQRVPLKVHNPHRNTVAGWPVTGGVPLPRGQLARADHVRLLREGVEVPVQVRPTGTWLDGSLKWILLTFLADVPAGGESVYTLEFGRNVHRKQNLATLSLQRKGKEIHIDTGKMRFRIDHHGEIADLRTRSPATGADGERLIPAGKTCGTVIRGPGGKVYRTSLGDAEITVEEAGPVRVLIKTVCTATHADGKRSFRIEKRIAAYAGARFLRIWHTYVNTCPEMFTDIEDMSFVVPGTYQAWNAKLRRGAQVVLDTKTPGLRQRLDNEYVTVDASKQETPAKGRLVGTLVSVEPADWAVAVRDAWQNYPKGFRLSPAGLEIGLCPDFKAGLYDEYPFEKEGHQLYYYLRNGRYRFKTGMAKTHEMLLCFEPEPQRASICAAFQRPLLAAAPPKWYCDSQAFYHVAPRDPKKFQAYEQGIDRNLKRYVTRRDRQRDYGLMNYGDWYGERGSNWGNAEYDTQHAFFLQYIRSGDPEAFFLGEATELHNRDIDTVQWSADRDRLGFVYIHQMCHVGHYYYKKVPGTMGWYRAGGGVSHAWTEGHFDHYFLTGDERSLETGVAITDRLARIYFKEPYDFSSVRNPGWHLILNAASYAATGDPYYLNASRVIIDRVLEKQDQEAVALPSHQREPGREHQVGGWSRQLLPGHCMCVPRCRGNAGFMVAILLIGLKYYDNTVDDPRVKPAIIRGAHYLLDECYSEHVKGFRYTSCCKMKYEPGGSLLQYEGIARAYRWTKDERFKKALLEGLLTGFGGSGYGKGFSASYRCGPRLLADIEDLFPP